MAVVISTTAFATAACQALGSPTAPDPSSNGTLDVQADAAFCVEQVNGLRASVGAPALVQSDDMAAFSTEAARVDGEAHEAHKYFRETNGGNGAAMAENEIPWWTLGRYGSVREIVRQGLAIEWAEGPGGGHYENITGRYSQMSCGISIANGEVTVSQDFR
jgi:uncharacterized protein YkwD